MEFIWGILSLFKHSIGVQWNVKEISYYIFSQLPLFLCRTFLLMLHLLSTDIIISMLLTSGVGVRVALRHYVTLRRYGASWLDCNAGGHRILLLFLVFMYSPQTQRTSTVEKAIEQTNGPLREAAVPNCVSMTGRSLLKQRFVFHTPRWFS